MAMMKMMDGVEYSPDCFAYVPDKDNPSTWKLRIKEKVGDKFELTRGQLDKAAQQMGGAMKDIPPTDVAKVKAALRGAYQQMGVKAEDMPMHIRESIDFNFSGTEFCDSGFREARVEGNVIRNLAFISEDSKNARVYSDQALDDIIHLGEGGRLFANHPKKNERGEVRDIREMIGKAFNLKKVVVSGKSLVRGDAEILENHSGWIIPIVRQMPELAGFSFEGGGQGHRSNGKEIVEGIHRFSNFALVTEPAATKNLFEQIEGRIEDMEWKEVTLETVKEKAPAIFQLIEAQGIEKGKTSTNNKGDGMTEEIKKKVDLLESENKDLKTKVNDATVKLSVMESKDLIDTKIKASDLKSVPETLIKDIRESLVGKKPEEMDAAITARIQMLKDTGYKFVTSPVKGMGNPKDFKESVDKIDSGSFVRAVRG